MSAVNMNDPPSSKPPKLCLVCKTLSAQVYRVYSSSGEEKNLKALIERYGGVGVRMEDVICRNCLSRLQTVHKLSTDLRIKCQTNAAKDGGKVFMMNLPVPATLTAPSSTSATTKGSLTIPITTSATPTAPKSHTPTTKPSGSTGPAAIGKAPQVTSATPDAPVTPTAPSRLMTAKLLEPASTPMAMVSCSPVVPGKPVDKKPMNIRATPTMPATPRPFTPLTTMPTTPMIPTMPNSARPIMTMPTTPIMPPAAPTPISTRPAIPITTMAATPIVPAALSGSAIPMITGMEVVCFMCGNTSPGLLRIVNPHASQGKMKQLAPAIEEAFAVKIDFENYPKLRACLACYNTTLKAQRLKRGLVAHLTNTQYHAPPLLKYKPEAPTFGPLPGVNNLHTEPPHFRNDDHIYCKSEHPEAKAERLIKRGGIFRRQHNKVDPKHKLVEAFKNDKEVREKIEQMILMDIKTSCDRLCSLAIPPGPSVLRNNSLEELEKQDLVSAIICEMEQAMPFALDVFKTICSPVHTLATNTKRTVATLYAMAMYCRNTHMCAVQVLNSIAIHRYMTKNNLLDVMQKCSFTLFASRNKAVLQRAMEKPIVDLTGEGSSNNESMETELLIDRVLESQNYPRPKRFTPLTVKMEIKKEKERNAESASAESASADHPSQSETGDAEFLGTDPLRDGAVPMADVTDSSPSSSALGATTSTPRPTIKKEPKSASAKKKKTNKPKTPKPGEKRKSTSPKKKAKKPKKESSATPIKRIPKVHVFPRPPSVPAKTTVLRIPPQSSGVSSEVDEAISNLYTEIVELDMTWAHDENFVDLSQPETVCLDGAM